MTAEQCNIRSRLHVVRTEREEKITLSPHDDKRCLLLGATDTLPWGHYACAPAAAQAAREEEEEEEEGIRVQEEVAAPRRDIRSSELLESNTPPPPPSPQPVKRIRLD